MMHRTAPRRGFSIVEMLVAITVGVIVFGMIISVIHVMMSGQRQGEVRARQQLSISRLNRRFREDVARSDSVEIDKAGDTVRGLHLKQGEMSVRWSATGSGIMRESTSPVSASTKDLLWLGSGVQAEWLWKPEQHLAVVTLRLPRWFVPDSAPERSPQEERRDTLSIVAPATAMSPADGEGK
ncbi:MAG: prepilin-type N-terminal cleavage/methylation domain-containing protein [Planctomycetaceae bacterium]|nr:prepilin-type N-terminal cleavage/methylation domain-containing protein [Planctomycetaceae bacterium]